MIDAKIPFCACALQRYLKFKDFRTPRKYLKGSGEDCGNPHQHDFEILQCKVNLRS